jgi:hypothetical protein
MSQDVCAICEKGLGSDCVTNDDGEPVHVDCLRFVLGHKESQAVFRCPNCHELTPHPRGALWDKLLASWLTCVHCGKEFLTGEKLK